MRYQRKYYPSAHRPLAPFGSNGQDGGEELEKGTRRGKGDKLTWLVQTLLKVTKAKVCAIIEVARSFFATTRGIRTAERSSWGMKARDSVRKGERSEGARLE